MSSPNDFLCVRAQENSLDDILPDAGDPAPRVKNAPDDTPSLTASPTRRSTRTAPSPPPIRSASLCEQPAVNDTATRSPPPPPAPAEPSVQSTFPRQQAPISRPIRAASNCDSSEPATSGGPPRIQRVRSSPLSANQSTEVAFDSLDVPKIVDLVQQLDVEYAQMGQLTVTLLLGETGAGKSTAVNFLAGRKFSEQKAEVELTVKGKVMKLRKTTIECVDPLTDATQTRVLRLYHTEKGLHLCDPPGLEDTLTPSVDVANAIAISNVLRRSSRVVILLLIRWSLLEERGQGLKKLLELVAKFLPSFSEAHLSSFRCVFTHVPNDKTHDDVATKIAELLQGDVVQTHSLFRKFLEWLLEVVVAHQEVAVLRPLTQEFQPLHDWIMSAPGLAPLDTITPLSHPTTFLLAQYCSEVAVASGSSGARALEPESYKRMLMNLRILSYETRLPELKDHWKRYETQLQRLASELIPQLQDSLGHRAFIELEQQLGLLERVQEVLGTNLLGAVVAKVGDVCQQCLVAAAASANLLSLVSNLSDTRALQDRLSIILPSEYRNIHEQCIEIVRETAEKYRERLTDIVESNDFEQVATEMDLLVRGVDSCKSFLDFSKLQEEVVELVQMRIRANISIVQEFLQDWNFVCDQAPNLTIEEEPQNGTFTAYTVPSLAEPAQVASTVVMQPIVPNTPRSRAKLGPRPGLGEPESQEDDKTGVIVLEGRKKFAVEVKVGGEFGRKVEWSFAIPDGNKATFTVTFRDTKSNQKPIVISTLSCATHVGKYEAAPRTEGVVIFVWENKGANILKSPKPAQFAYAIHVWATNASALLPPPPPPPPPKPKRESLVEGEKKVEDPVWLAIVARELALPEPAGARNVIVPNAVFSAFRALSGYRDRGLLDVFGDEIAEGVLALQNFVEDAKLRLSVLQRYWNEKNFTALSCSIWRVWVLRRFSNPELSGIVTESKSFYDNMFKTSVSVFEQLVSDAKKASVWQICAAEESARAWLMLHLQHQKDLVRLFHQARTFVLERLSRFYHALTSLSMKALAAQFVEQVAPFHLNYPIAVNALTTSVVQRFTLQAISLESDPISASSLQAIEDIFSGIVQFQAYERYADIQTETTEIIVCYKRLLKRIDTVLVEMSEDPHDVRFLDTLFLAFSCFSKLKAQSELSPDYVYGVSILEKFVSDPLQTEHLGAFLRWSKATLPEWFQCTVEIIDEAAPSLPSIFALFPNLCTAFRDLKPLRALLGRMRQLNELCQGSSVTLRQTLEATRTALDKRLLELLVAIRKVRPPPPSLTVLIAGCASDDLIGSASFNQEWDLALNKLQRDSALCQRGWKEYTDILQDCRRKADGRRLLVVLDKPLFDIFRIIWRANVPFSVFHALTALGDWWAQEVKAACVEPRASLEEKGSSVRLQLPAEVLMSVRTLWKAYFILRNTLAKLETARFISSKSIEAFSFVELGQWLLEFLDKLVVLGTTAINGLHLSIINQLFQLFGELESLIAMQPELASTATPIQSLLFVCYAYINQLCGKYQEDKTTAGRCKLLLDIRRFCVAIDLAELTKFVRSRVIEMLDQTGTVAMLELGSALEADPLGLRLIHECPHFQLERTRIHNRLTGGMPFGLALEEMQRRTEPHYPLDVAKLSLAWNRYRDVSSPIMARLLDHKLALDDLVANARRLASGRDIPAILAHVCGAYSLLKSKGAAKTMMDTPIPHPTQMLAMFVMLLDALVVMLLDESKETHLVEIEAGKTLLLGLLATTLAVQGFEVHVACYSKALADKSRERFADMFTAFGVEDQVKYDTFSGLVNHTITCSGDIRALTENLIRDHSPPPLLSKESSLEADNPLPPPPPSTQSTQSDSLPPPPPPPSPQSSLSAEIPVSLSPVLPEHGEGQASPPPPPLETASVLTPNLDDGKIPIIEANTVERPPPPPQYSKSQNYTNLWDDDDSEPQVVGTKRDQKSSAKKGKASLFGDEEETKALSDRPRVLLMDDVVLIHREVAGSTEGLDLVMRSPTITAMCNYIFEHRARLLRMSALQRLDIYPVLLREIKPEAHSILRSCLRCLLVDVKKIDHPAFAYTIVEVEGRNMLGYHTRKGFDTETSHRGITMFQYMKEHANGRIDATMLDKKVGLYICCGAYAYVEMLNNYQRVFGVTGVYEKLEEVDKLLLRESFNVHRVTLSGSMYGYRKDRLQREPVRVLTSDDAQYLAIRETVDNVRKTAIEKKLKSPPILIMFENDAAIKKFTSQILNAQWIADLHRDCFIVRLSCENIDYALTKAMLPGAVTVFPASLGENLDFTCFESDMDEQQGVHVILTFLSLKLRDEIQIQNRTACSKHRGTFIRLFSLVQLKSLLGVVDTDVLRPHMDPEPILQRARHDFSSAQTGDRHQRVLEAKRLHERTWQYLEALLGGKASMDFVCALNPPPPLQVRLLCLVEATTVMRGVWTGLKSIVDPLIMRLEEFLGGIDNFKLKFVAFRDYDCDGHVTESSHWTNEPATLSTWLESIDLVAHDTVAMEAVLRVANDKDDSPTRVVLFGNSPPRAIKAEENHPYVLECKELCRQGIPVFAYHMGGAVSVYENIASLTNGTAKPLSAEDLLDLIAVNALDDIAT